MSTHRSRTMAASFTTVLTVLAALGFSDAGVALGQHPRTGPASVRCQWTTAELPHSPDAVEGWYRGCPPLDGPLSPTGVEGWTD